MKHRTAANKALQLPGGRWTAHELRRTAATLMAQLGVSSDVIDECLNHKIAGKSTRVYIRDRRLQAQAAAFDILGTTLSALTGLPVGIANRVELSLHSRDAAQPANA
jgi:integrase